MKVGWIADHKVGWIAGHEGGWIAGHEGGDGLLVTRWVDCWSQGGVDC